MGRSLEVSPCLPRAAAAAAELRREELLVLFHDLPMYCRMWSSVSLLEECCMS
jgi:hypothetical protein